MKEANSMKLNTHLKGCDTALRHCCEKHVRSSHYHDCNKETRLSLIVALMMLRNNVDLVDHTRIYRYAVTGGKCLGEERNQIKNKNVEN